MTGYRDHLASLRELVLERRASLASRMEILRRLRSVAVPPDLRALPDLPALDGADANRLEGLLGRLDARAHDVELAIAATDATFARLAFPGITLQEEIMGSRPVSRERVVEHVGEDALVEVLGQATLARFRRDGVGFVLAIGDARSTLSGRLAVAVPRTLPPIVGWPGDLLVLGDVSLPLPSGLRRPDGSFWLSHGRAVIAWQDRAAILPADAVTYLLAVRAAVEEAW